MSPSAPPQADIAWVPKRCQCDIQWPRSCVAAMEVSARSLAMLPSAAAAAWAREGMTSCLPTAPPEGAARCAERVGTGRDGRALLSWRAMADLLGNRVAARAAKAGAKPALCAP